MRDNSRMLPIINEIQRIWLKYPDMRYFQLMDYLMHSWKTDFGTDWFYAEDDKVLEWLKEQR